MTLSSVLSRLVGVVASASVVATLGLMGSTGLALADPDVPLPPPTTVVQAPAAPAAPVAPMPAVPAPAAPAPVPVPQPAPVQAPPPVVAPPVVAPPVVVAPPEPVDPPVVVAPPAPVQAPTPIEVPQQAPKQAPQVAPAPQPQAPVVVETTVAPAPEVLAPEVSTAPKPRQSRSEPSVAPTSAPSSPLPSDSAPAVETPESLSPSAVVPSTQVEKPSSEVLPSEVPAVTDSNEDPSEPSATNDPDQSGEESVTSNAPESEGANEPKVSEPVIPIEELKPVVAKAPEAAREVPLELQESVPEMVTVEAVDGPDDRRGNGPGRDHDDDQDHRPPWMGHDDDMDHPHGDGNSPPRDPDIQINGDNNQVIIVNNITQINNTNITQIQNPYTEYALRSVDTGRWFRFQAGVGGRLVLNPGWCGGVSGGFEWGASVGGSNFGLSFGGGGYFNVNAGCGYAPYYPPPVYPSQPYLYPPIGYYGAPVQLPNYYIPSSNCGCLYANNTTYYGGWENRVVYGQPQQVFIPNEYRESIYEAPQQGPPPWLWPNGGLDPKEGGLDSALIGTDSNTRDIVLISSVSLFVIGLIGTGLLLARRRKASVSDPQ